MRLFLASEAKNTTSLPALTDFVGGWQGKKLTYIPTAANGEGWGSWREGHTWPLVQTLGAKIQLIQLEDFRDNSVLPKLQGQDSIWMAGGSVGYLLYWIRRCEIDKALPGLLANGTIYVGSSAGSMITGQTSETMQWYVGESEPGAEVIPPLKLVDFDIYPHYQDEYFDHIQDRYQGKKMYLLKDGEAVIVDGEDVTVFGENRVIQKPIPQYHGNGII